MRRLLLLLVLLLGICLLSAQEINLWHNFRHSSRDDAGNIHIRWDNLTSDYLNLEFFAKSEEGDWASYPINHLAYPVSEAQVPFAWDVPLTYRLKIEQSYQGVGGAVLHPAWLSTDTFPPSVDDLAYIGADATGDSVTVYAPQLDLGDTWVGCSDDVIYFAMQNATGSFPTMNSFTSYNAYGCVIANPESALADSTAYAMIYANLLGFITPGLYKIGVTEDLTPTFSRIGNIQSVVSGGKLFLACNLADLTSDPSFGTWPNYSNALAFTALTMKMDMSFGSLEPEIGIGDYSMPGIVVFEKLIYEASGNTLPVVTETKVENNIVSCFYQDAEGDFPLVCRFTNQLGEVTELQSILHDYSGGVMFAGTCSAETRSGELIVSDNNIDFQSFELEIVSNDDYLLPSAALACSVINPIQSGSELKIKLSNLQAGELELQLYNIRGQKIWSYSGYPTAGKELTLSWDALVRGKYAPAGVYLLKVQNGSSELIKKFSIIR